MVRFLAMTGDWPRGWRCHGWAAALQMTEDALERELTDAWERHRTAWMQEADDAGFRPYWCDKKQPRGPGLTRWCQQFRARHGY